MEAFENIRDESYLIYQAFNRKIKIDNNYNVDLTNPNKCLFQIANKEFTILPVATASETLDDTSLIIFGKDHPAKFVFPQLEPIIENLGIPRKYIPENENQNSATPCFRFGYKLTALVCMAVAGKTFLSICPRPKTWVWFVILKGNSKASKKILDDLPLQSALITKEQIDEWYNKTKI